MFADLNRAFHCSRRDTPMLQRWTNACAVSRRNRRAQAGEGETKRCTSELFPELCPSGLLRPGSPNPGGTHRDDFSSVAAAGPASLRRHRNLRERAMLPLIERDSNLSDCHCTSVQVHLSRRKSRSRRAPLADRKYKEVHSSRIERALSAESVWFSGARATGSCAQLAHKVIHTRRDFPASCFCFTNCDVSDFPMGARERKAFQISESDPPASKFFLRNVSLGTI
jgi:hypothetical protein